MIIIIIMGMVQPWLPCLVTDLSAGCMLRINISETKPFCNINYCLKSITQLTCACYIYYKFVGEGDCKKNQINVLYSGVMKVRRTLTVTLPLTADTV